VGRRVVPVALGLTITLVVVLVMAATGGGDHTLRAAFTSALQIRPGQHVEVAGRTVGSVRSAKLVDGRAVVEMAIDDDHWPFHRGTTASLRFGSPLGYALRYVDLKPGPSSAPALAEDGILSQRETITPVEFAELPRTYGPRTRRDLARMLKNSGAALDGAGPDIGRLLDQGAPGAQGVADATADLAEDPHALKVLVAASELATGQIARNQDRLGPLVRDANTTVNTLLERSPQLTELLDEAPGALREGTRTLAHLNTTSGRLERLASDFAPGARSLRALAPVAGRATDLLATEAPQVARLLNSANRISPPLTRFLQRGNATLPGAGKAAGGLADLLACLRPYTPELAGYLSTTLGANASYDANGHYIRMSLATYPVTIPSNQTPAQVTSQFPNLHYGMVRPPGQNVGQPWFQPSCGITARGLNAADDPEVAR
jgi:virulence factor Mce-like protein